MMTKIVDKMTKDLDLRLYHDGYKERIEALITSKMKGEGAQVEEEKPKSSILAITFFPVTGEKINTFL
jgi:non-homologous end joining protein Ku